MAKDTQRLLEEVQRAKARAIRAINNSIVLQLELEDLLRTRNTEIQISRVLRCSEPDFLPVAGNFGVTWRFSGHLPGL